MILQDKNTAVPGSSYYKNIMHASTSIVEENNGVVTKTFDHDWFSPRENWLKSYNNLRKWDTRYVEVYEVGSNFIKMKYEPNTVHLREVIDGKTNHSDDVKLKLLSEYIKVFYLAHSYVAHSNEVFIHNDLNTYNILVNENNELIIIDPDSCSNRPRFDRILPDLISDYTRSMHRYYELLHNKVKS